MFVVAISLAAALSASALFSDAAPPQRYREATSFTLVIADQNRIERTCQPLFGKPGDGQKTLGCTVGKTVTLPNPCDFPETDTYARMVCHELGHINGWPATHDE
jgi:hypothetical protein